MGYAGFIPSRTWAEVNLDNIAHNYHAFEKLTSRRVMCVIKANGYGHGACAIAFRLEREGCGAFAVATVDEAIELRRSGIKASILVLNHIPADRVLAASHYGLTLTVYSEEMAKEIHRRAINPVKVHVKIDTGMTRVGFNPENIVQSVRNIRAVRKVEVEGIYTHFACADEEDAAYTELQTQRFKQACKELEDAGINIPVKHAANSAASIMYPDTWFDMVRVGISLYGCYPSGEADKARIDLLPAMQLKSQIFRINDVSEGVSASYGRVFTTRRQTRLATIPAGYADGISRVLTGKLTMLVNGQPAPVAGRICMDQCILDITDIEGDVRVNDEVVIFGAQSGSFAPVERIASLIGTISYEVLCAVQRRVPRFYYENGEIVKCVGLVN